MGVTGGQGLVAAGAPQDGVDGLVAVVVVDDDRGADGVGEISVAPLQQGDEDGEQGEASVGQPVLLPGRDSGFYRSMPMLDAFIPEDALSSTAEKELLAKLTDILLLHEGVDPADPRHARSRGCSCAGPRRCSSPDSLPTSPATASSPWCRRASSKTNAARRSTTRQPSRGVGELIFAQPRRRARLGSGGTQPTTTSSRPRS